jgi:predicted nucleic acid-binding protein
VTETGDAPCYVETSGLLSALFEQDADAKRLLRRATYRVTSALTFAEARRAVVRARQSERLTVSQARSVARALHTFAKRCQVVAVTEEVLGRAGRPFVVEPVRTLDAIHLATLELLGGSPALITVLTRDERVRKNALAGGYSVA